MTKQEPQQLSASNKNGTKIQWNMSEAVLLIESFVKDDKSLAEIKAHFFEDHEGQVGASDICFVENVYDEKFIVLLPEKGQQYIAEIFEGQRWDAVNVWLEGIYLEKFTVWECLEKTKPPLFDIIRCRSFDKTILGPFFHEIQSCFASTFLTWKSLNESYRLYQSLLYCSEKTPLSTTFINALKQFPCFQKVVLVPETDIIHNEHRLFADLVNNQNIDKHDLTRLNLLIEKLFKNVIKIYRENGDKIFEITGRQIVWSNVSEVFVEDYANESISQLRLIAKHLVVLDANVKLFGKNFVLIAPKIMIPNFVTCDLSGTDAADTQCPKAENGSENDKNGKNGIDGVKGKSSGSMVICAPEVIHSENLSVILNGGNGSNGQDGGNGFDGKNGVGKEFKKAFGFGAKLKLRTVAIGNVLLGGLPGIVNAYYSESIRANNIKRIKSFSTHKWPSSHSMVVYNGTKGSPGGLGGLNGIGGSGGKKGSLTFLKDSIELLQVQANDGKDGETGKLGENGADSQDGWDVACIKKSFGRLRKYGKNNNEKIEIVFADKEDKDTVYVKNKDTGVRSLCYAKIVNKPLRNQTLQNNEQKKESKRNESAIPTKTKNVNLNAVEKIYQQICSSATNATTDVQVIHYFNRITERQEIPAYIPKRAIIPSDSWKNISENTKAQFEEKFADFINQYCLISDNTDFEMNLLKPILDKLLNFVNGGALYKHMQLLYTENHKIVTDFVLAMLTTFEASGCRIDYTAFAYFVETVFHTIHKKKNFEFSSILLTMDQSEWMDAFFIYNSERTLNVEIPDKEEFRQSLKKVIDDNFKISCSKWLYEFPISLSEFLDVIKATENVIAPVLLVDKTYTTEWPKVLKYSKINSNLSVNKEDSEHVKLIKFWCCKLAPYYSYDEVEETFKLLHTQKDVSLDKENIGRLVHRLCIYDFVAGDFNPREDPTVGYLINEVFACYLQIPLNQMSETFNIARKVVDQFKSEISNDGIPSDHLDKLWKECCIGNTFEQYDKNIMADISDIFCNDLFDKFAVSGGHWDLEDFQYQIKKTRKLQRIDVNICLLKFVMKVISEKFNIHLRVNQKIAILTAVRGQHSKGILQQLPTGEGKSLIIVVASIILTWKHYIVNIVTSSYVLAKRDVLQYLPIYEIFGIKVNHICDGSPNVRAEKYATCHVLYGDLASFQRDFLLDAFYSMDITNNREFDRVMVDEVDSLLLDQGANMLYLSHEISDMERLQPLFVKIWQVVNTYGAIVHDNLYTFIYDNCFPLLVMTKFNEYLDLTEKDVKILKTALKKNGIISNDEEVLISSICEIDEKFEKVSGVSHSTLQTLKFVFHQLLHQERLIIPLHLHKFVKHHLEEFITNAKAAMYMEEGIQYLVDMVPSHIGVSYEPKIIIIDQNTGVDMASTQWSNGLQQFLQLKHGLRMTPISLKAVYISGVSYFKKYNQIYGFSGTMGSRKERIQLWEKYNVDLRLVPSSIPRLFYEEINIVTTKKEGCKDSHVNQIFEVTNAKLNVNRSILIICESIKQADAIITALKSLAVKELAEEAQLPFINATLYRRDSDKFKYGEGTELPPKSIIFSTSLAGRGTNIVLTDELRQCGGLHVIVAFLPRNLRIEEQAFGRAARSGDCGSGQLIFCVECDCFDNLTDFVQLKLLQIAQDNHKVEMDYDYYENKVDVEEACFENFARNFRKCKKELDVQKLDKDEKTLILRDSLDRWALWLDTYPSETLSNRERILAKEKCYNALKEMPKIDTKSIAEAWPSFQATIQATLPLEEQIEVNTYVTNVMKTLLQQMESCKYKNPVNQRRITAAEVFCNNLATDIIHSDNSRRLTQPSNILNRATKLIEKNEYNAAAEILNWLVASYPNYAPEAKYYLIFINIKQHGNLTQDKNEEYQQLAKSAEEVRSEFERRIFSYFTDRAFIEYYKETDGHKIFKADVFSQQQMELSKIVSLHLESIDVLLGGRLHSKSFMTSLIPEEASYLLYQYFTDSSNFTKLPIKTTKVCEGYDVEKLKEYSQKHDICFKLLFEKLESLKDVDIHQSDLIQGTYLPTAEAFWHELLANDILITPQRHFFVDTIKFKTMNMKLVGVIKDLILDKQITMHKRLFKHSYVLAENWKGLNVGKMEERLSTECINILTDIGAFCETTSAELNLKPLSSVNFDSFSKLATDDLLSYSIPETVVCRILNSLINSGVLIAVGNDTFFLSDNYVSAMEQQKLLDIPLCYEEVIWKAINKNLAFAIAYRKIHECVKNNYQLQINLPCVAESTIFFDLIDMGVLKRPNVDFIALKSISKAAKPLTAIAKAIYQDAVSSDSSIVNVEVAAKKTKEKCRSMLEPKYNDQKEEKIKDYKHITSDKDKIYRLFIKNAPARERFETLDVKLCSLWDKLTECNLVETRTPSMFSSYVTHLIKFNEKRWSQKTITKLSLVFLAASAQLAIGTVIMITTTGGGIPISKYFFSQALSDIIYVLKGCQSGYAENYIKYKLVTMIMGAVPSITWVRHLINAPEKNPNPSINIAEIVVNKFKSRILSAAINISISSIFQSKLDNIIEYVCDSTTTIILNLFEKEVANRTEVFNSIFAKIDFNVSKQLIGTCFIAYALVKITQVATNICNFVFVQYRDLFIKFDPNITNDGNQEKDGSLFDKLVGTASFFKHKAEFRILISKMEQEIGITLDELNKTIQEKAGIRNENSPNDNSKRAYATKIQEATNLIIKDFKCQMKETVEEVVNSRVTQPMIALITSKLQKTLENRVIESFDEFKNKNEERKAHPKNYHFNRNTKIAVKEKKDAKLLYEDMLYSLLYTTKNPSVYAYVIMEGIEINETTCKVIAGAITSKLPVNLIINYADDKIFRLPATHVETINLDLNINLLHKDKKENRVFNAIIMQMPALLFTDDDEFRKTLIEVIKNDPDCLNYLETERQPPKAVITPHRVTRMLDKMSVCTSLFKTFTATELSHSTI